MISADELRSKGLATGAVAVGWASAGPVSHEARQLYLQYLDQGRFASMEYMGRHLSVRFNPCELLEGAHSVISFAFSYVPVERREDDLIALYAYGRDYHKELPKRLRPFCRYLEQTYGAATRICVDSAPIMERYWATRAGLGHCGRNGALIVPGYGSLCFLAEVVTDAVIEPSVPHPSQVCVGCDLCVAACPTGALSANGFHATCCLSYLTIEHRGPWTREVDPNRVPLFGCDACLRSCPHNHGVPSSEIPAFRLRQEVRTLTPEQVMRLNNDRLTALLPASPIRRAGIEGLQRNASIKLSRQTGR